MQYVGTMRSPLARAGALFFCLLGFLSVFLVAVRPWFRAWGADEALRHAALPGDGLLPNGRPRETRAVVIEAPASAVWPWVAQLGQDRGGFYSFAVLENLVGCELHNLDHLEPELQSWKPGDRLWMYPPAKAGGVGQAPLALHEAGRALVFYTRRPGTRLVDPPDGTWAFIVEPVDPRTSRFIGRATGTPSPGLLGAAFEGTVFEPIHFAMERKMMEGVKLRAEGGRPSDAADVVLVVLWTVTFGLCIVSAACVLAGRDAERRLATFVASGGVFAALTLGQPSLRLAIPVVLALAAATVWPRRR
jgi:hypothetical protein